LRHRARPRRCTFPLAPPRAAGHGGLRRRRLVAAQAQSHRARAGHGGRRSPAPLAAPTDRVVARRWTSVPRRRDRSAHRDADGDRNAARRRHHGRRRAAERRRGGSRRERSQGRRLQGTAATRPRRRAPRSGPRPAGSVRHGAARRRCPARAPASPQRRGVLAQPRGRSMITARHHDARRWAAVLGLAVAVVLVPSLALAQTADPVGSVAQLAAGPVVDFDAAAPPASGAQTALRVLLMMTVLSLLPALVLTMTSFTRIIIVFTFLRQALGIQGMPPNQVLTGMALF